MNTKMKIQALLFGLLIGIMSFAQSNKLSSSRSINLQPNSKAQNIEVEVVGKVDQLRIEVYCTINQGAITVEIFDPKGEAQGKFKAGDPEMKAPPANSQNELFGDPAEQGRLEKFVEKPENGVWMVRMTPQNAQGQVRVSSRQYYAEE